MKMNAVSGELSTKSTNALVAGIYENEKTLSKTLQSLDKILNNSISQCIKEKRISGKLSEIELFHAPLSSKAKLIAIVGLGKRKELTSERLRALFGDVSRFLRRHKVSSFSTELLGEDGVLSARERAQSISEGALLGLYKFKRYLTKKANTKEITTLSILSAENDIDDVREGIRIGQIISEAVIIARDMENEPSNSMGPSDIEVIAKEIASKNDLDITVFGREGMASLGMNAALSVSQGSSREPKFIILSYNGKKTSGVDLALVGKGITFDSGGISLKPAEGMGSMKGDMAGAATVIAVMSAAAKLKPKLNVSALVAAVENMPSGTAYRPGDIVTAMNGKTIEIISTDAEGRLTLADAVTHAKVNLKAKAIIDVATLTGACVIALGHVASAVMGNNQGLIDKVLTAGKETGEKNWQLPLYEEYKEQNKSDIADIKNAGGRPAGTITAGLFIGEFIGSTPWVHIDIAGVDQSDKEQGYTTKGATGIPVRTLIKLVQDLAFKN